MYLKKMTCRLQCLMQTKQWPAGEEDARESIGISIASISIASISGASIARAKPIANAKLIANAKPIASITKINAAI